MLPAFVIYIDYLFGTLIHQLQIKTNLVSGKYHSKLSN